MGTTPMNAPAVMRPSSIDEAISDFGDGDGTVVLGGGTILMVERFLDRAGSQRVLMLDHAGLAGISSEGGGTTIGAMTPVAALETAAEPLGSAARQVADLEIRAQATLGGNLCAPPAAESPRGDLQAPLIALGAQVRSVGHGGERTEPLEEFLAGGSDGRLLLEVSFDEPTAAASSSVRRPHAHAYTVLAVSGARTGGELRLAVTGAAPHAVRLTSVERALADGADERTAAARAIDDVSPADDALASAWYREKTLPVLVTRVLNDLSMKESG
jgi:aerobic carbon-monoxide dehydrogenase medium subunit